MAVSEKSQYRQVAKLLEKRILHGDYLLKELPAGRLLATEMGVSHIVARKAMEVLTEKGLLARKPNGRLVTRRTSMNDKHQVRLAFVAPAFASSNVQLLRMAVQLEASKVNALFRPVEFVHWDDPVFDDVMEGFDGAFIMPSTDPIPEGVVARLERANCRVATFHLSLVSRGIPVITQFELSDIRCLLNHLYELGHRRIGCFNTQPEDPELLARIGIWRQWLKERDLSGPLISDPVRSFERPMVRAYEAGKRLLQRSLPDCTALYCPTEAVAKGLVRAMVDSGLQPGRELSVCTLDDEDEARYVVPTLTSIRTSDLSLRVKRVLDWMMHPGQSWTGDLKLRAAEPQLFIGESVGPVVTDGGKK